MVDKANDIYTRWANGQELPTIVLRHITEDAGSFISGDEHDNDRRSPMSPPEDPFLYTHQSLAQCIAEVHQIARTMFPLRKPCNCSSRGAQANGNGKQTTAVAGERKPSPPNASTTVTIHDCPPSHEWSPPPIVNATSPVLPEAPPIGYVGGGSGVGIGYPAYNGTNGRVNNSYSSLKGSGMSPSPSPGLPAVYHNTATNGAGNTSNGTYTGYPNGAGGMYSPTNSNGPYPKTNSPPFATTPVTSTPPPLHAPSHSHHQHQHHPHYNNAHGINNGTGTGLYASVAVLPASGAPVTLPPASSKLAMMDTINFELGALSANSEQSFMVFY